MKRKWFRLLLAVPLIGILCFTNIYQDPANIFHNDSKSIADALLSGHAAYIGSGNGNERNVKRYTIEGMPKYVECITIGPSLSMGIRKADVGTDNYINLSASSINFNEYMAWLAMLKANNISFDRIILCVDSYFFDDERTKSGTRLPEMKAYAEYMMAYLDGNEPSLIVEDNLKQLQMQFEQAFSITYFQASCNQIRSNNSYVLTKKRWGIVDDSTESLAHYLPDGSWVYESSYQANTTEYVVADSNGYNIEGQFCCGKHISELSKSYFVKMIDYLQKNNVTIEFFYCPLPPTLWERIYSGEKADQYYILNEIDEFTRQIASERGIKTTGAYNPSIAGVTDDDFWDARHMRHDLLSKYFDFRK